MSQETQPFHLSLFSYDVEGIDIDELVQQDQTRPTDEYDEDGNEIEEHLYWCYPRIVFANDKKEAETKYIQHLTDTAKLPSNYDVSIGVDDVEDHEIECEGGEIGYSLAVVK